MGVGVETLCVKIGNSELRVADSRERPLTLAESSRQT